MSKFIRLLIGIIIVWVVLWIGGTSYLKFATDVELSDFSVFGKLLEKLALILPQTDPTEHTTIAEESTESTETSEVASSETTTEETSTNIDNTQTNEKDLHQSISSFEDLKQLLSTIKISSEKPKSDYNRDDYEAPAKRYELNGEKLSRNKYSAYTSSHLISRDPFVYHCPYTGLKVEDDSKLDYDHIIALNYVHQYGDTNWSIEEKNNYSYDLSIGVNVWYNSNRSKSDKGPSEWLPDINIEDYCYTWLAIASEHKISLRQKDIDICVLMCKNALDSGHVLRRID